MMFKTSLIRIIFTSKILWILWDFRFRVFQQIFRSTFICNPKIRLTAAIIPYHINSLFPLFRTRFCDGQIRSITNLIISQPAL